MLHPDSIAKVDAMRLAGAPTVSVILPLREEGGENAVLHMEHRHVLVKREFKPLRGSLPQEVEHLSDIQIVADRHPVEATTHEKLSRERIGNIEGKVPDSHQPRVPEMLDRPEVADQDSIGLCIGDQLEETLLGGFLNTRSGKEDPGISMIPHESDRLLVAPDILEIDIHLANSLLQGR